MPTAQHPTRTFDTALVADRLQQLVERTGRGRHVHGLVLAVASDDGSTLARTSAGNTDLDAPYFIASISKMYTAAIIGQLVDDGTLRDEDRVVDLLPDLDLRGLHVRDGVDATAQIRLCHLLDQTSGIADYFAGGVEKDLAAGSDRSYGVQEVVDLARRAGAEFAPGDREGGRAAYSDTNYLLLTAIIEAVTGGTYAAAVERRIATPLGLARTYDFDGDDTTGIGPVHHRDTEISFPRALASEKGAGGLVSTIDEQLRFSRAFHSGELFDLERPRFNRVFFNVDYGGGTMRFQVPRWMMLGATMPELIGHSGWTGSFLFHSRELGVHLAGTFNQIDSPVRPFRLMPKVTRIVERAQSRP